MKKIEYLENVPKADIDTAQKLMSRLDEITAHLKSKFYLFYNSIYKDLKTYNSDFFFKWVDQCLLPYGPFLFYVNNYVKETQNEWFRYIGPSASEMNELYTYGIWELSKSVYRFDENLLKSLPKQRLDVKIPAHVLKNLPEWCVYVETSSWDISGPAPYGYFALVDYHSQDGFILRISLDFPTFLLPLGFALNPNNSFEEVLNDEETHYYNRESEYSDMNDARIKAEEYGLKINYKRQVFSNPKESQNVYSVEWKEYAKEVLKKIIPQLLYLCAANSELSNETNPSQLITRSTLTVSKDKQPFLSVNEKPCYIYVGKTTGSLLRDTTEPINFDFIGKDVNQYIEIKHKQIKSISKTNRDEEKNIEMIVSLANSMSAVLEQYKETQKSLQRISKENLEIKEDNKKYFDEIIALDKELADTHREFAEALEQQIKDFYGNSKEELQIDNLHLDVIRKVIQDKTLTATECLKLIEYCYADRVQILNNAWDSAKEIDSIFTRSDKLKNLLIKLVTDYLDCYLENGDSKARLLFGENYAAQESETVETNPTLKRQRTFSGVTMFQHLKIGVAHNPSETARVYFWVNKDSHKVLIGYCGKHLEISKR